MDNNLVYHSGSNDVYYILDTTTAYTLVEFKAAFGSWEQNSIQDNPDFTTVGSDFTLKPASPARNAAIPITGYNTRLDPTSSWPDDVRTRGDSRTIGGCTVNSGAAGM